MNKPRWILLAEDSVHDANLVLHALSAGQATEQVLVARDGAEALDCLYRRGPFETRAAGNPTVVMLDLKMPKVDGLEALQKIKSDPQLKNIPVVMFTSSREETDVARSYELGANAYVVKPVDFKQFLISVKELRRFWIVVNQPPPDPSDQIDFQPPQLASVA